MSKIAKIAVAAATYWVDRPYSYLIPDKLLDDVIPGKRVIVPFSRGNRRTEGIVLALDERSAEKLKCIESVLDPEPVLDEGQIKLALWMRERFFCTVYDAVKCILPSGLWFKSDGKRRVNDKTLKMVSLAIDSQEALELAGQKRASAPVQAEILRTLCTVGRVSVPELKEFTGAGASSLKALEKDGIIQYSEVEVLRRPEYRTGIRAPLPELNFEQKKAYDGICGLLDEDGAHAALLFGVTGSGKTTVYIHLIEKLTSSGKGAILLVPEIALTPQMLETFSSYFGDRIAVLHSSLAPGERYDEWKRIRSGEAKIVIGTRSAVFAPVHDLGIIIIDEEQELTYKSENVPRYHARDVAKYRCAKNGALLLMGSATPDIESFYNAREGVYSFFTLPGRYNSMALPGVHIVDMKRELRDGNGSDISSVLRRELEENLSRGEQSILFLNRRGASKLVTCSDCGFTYECPNCSVSLTYHSHNKRLLCHYCGHIQRVDSSCPDCGGKLNYIGTGTQKVTAELNELFPGVEVLRMDADTVAPAGSHEVLLERFREQNIPIMVGTQMVAKGLNFESVTLVGVISADQSLYSGDYRANERTFSLITQVVGRSGRGERPGRAVIQTYTPENQVIRLAAAQDYVSFFDSEIALRRVQGSPPFADMFSITASGQDEARVLKCCAAVRSILEKELAGSDSVRILGPAPMPVVRVNNRFRYRVTLACKANSKYRDLVSRVIVFCNTCKDFRGVSVYADTNPQD